MRLLSHGSAFLNGSGIPVRLMPRSVVFERIGVAERPAFTPGFVDMGIRGLARGTIYKKK
jgi:hypothetical protein